MQKKTILIVYYNVLALTSVFYHVNIFAKTSVYTLQNCGLLALALSLLTPKRTRNRNRR